MNICMVGYGMMGVWHSDALSALDVCLHTSVGRRPEPTREFATRYGYRDWTTDFEQALADPAIDIVILANPSEQHAATALAAIAAGKHTLVEIPVALNLADAERVVSAAHERGVLLGVVHPYRARPEWVGLRERVRAGEEHLRQVCGRFYIHRLENVGATGYRRSWTDNILWHHTTHLLDCGLWLLDAPVRRLYSFMPALDEHTGIPMDVFIGVETERDQSLICTGSYYGRERVFELLVISDRDSYRMDVVHSTLTTGAGPQPIAHEAENCALVTCDFVQAVRDRRAPVCSGESVLPVMRALQQVQDHWDVQHGSRAIPGRPL